MKRTLLVLLILVALAAGMLLIVTSETPPAPGPRVDLSFMQFTNTPTGPSALLAVHFGPRFGGCGWTSFETSRRVDGAWQSWSPETYGRNRQFFDQQGSSPPRTPDGRKIHCIIAMPVENTNDVWRFVVKVDENTPGPTHLDMLAWNLKAIMGKATPGPPQGTGPRQSYSLTNETRASKMN